MMNIIFIAPPAAGKGTVSDYLVKNFGYEHLSTGDMLRAEVASGSALGKEIDALISKGSLVSDELIIKLVQSKLMGELRDKLFILDGFPRNLAQAQKLDEMLISMGVTNNVVIYLDVTREEATKRAVGRIVCPECGRSYNLYFPGVQPMEENICDDCGVSLVKRSDDTEDTFKVRFESYLGNTMPILDYYKEKGLLREVSTMCSKEDILSNVLEVINNEDVNVKRRKSD